MTQIQIQIQMQMQIQIQIHKYKTHRWEASFQMCIRVNIQSTFVSCPKYLRKKHVWTEIEVAVQVQDLCNTKQKYKYRDGNGSTGFM